MNILFLTHSYPDEKNRWRGAFIKEQAEALSSVHKVIVVFFRNDLSRFTPLKRKSHTVVSGNNLVVYTVTSYRTFPVLNQVKHLYGTYRFIKDVIVSETKIDVVHSHLSWPAGFLGIFVAGKLQTPAVLTEHSWITNYFRSTIHRYCAMYALKNSSKIITVSRILKSNLEAYCDREIIVIPNVVNTANFSNSQKEHGSVVNIGLLGGMGTKIKGVDILLKAVAMMDNPSIVVHIGGDGKYLADYKSLAKELGIDNKVIFHGEITSDKKSEFYSRLDIYIMASRKETFGVVVAEAMASGLPVISTKCGGPEELVSSENGILVEPENPRMLSEAIQNMATRLNHYNKNDIRNKAISEFGIESFIGRINALYKSLPGLSNENHG